MHRQTFIALITILTLISCESNISKNKDVETSIPEEIDSTVTLEAYPIIDTIEYDTEKVIEKSPVEKDTAAEKEKSNAEDNSINIEDALDVNKYKSVRDDPDYIGTPCEYLDGKCIRHNHKKAEELPEKSEGDL